jgi:hypothetical protein
VFPDFNDRLWMNALLVVEPIEPSEKRADVVTNDGTGLPVD